MIQTTPEMALGPLNETEKKNAPSELFVLGDIELLRSGAKVSVIGSRKASAKGLEGARKLVQRLVKDDIIIVSGLAEGIDTAAHRAAIESGGKTIAVIGTPLSQSFPKSNEALQSLIAKDHCLVSQFKDGSGGKKNFVLRNRTMALISDATIIVEAKDGSGTMYQAWETLRLGRPLYIFESFYNDETASWAQDLIKYGARCLNKESLDELIEFLPRTGRMELMELDF